MALRFMDSFDHYVTADLLEKWTTRNIAAIASGGGRNGTDALYFARQNYDITLTLDNQQTWVVGCAFYPDGAMGARNVIALYDDATLQVCVATNTDGTLSLYRGTTLLGTTDFALAIGTWYYVEFKVYIDNSSGTIEVRVNGDSKLALSSVDTQASGNAYANAVKLSGNKTLGAMRCYYDDLYICDGTGTTNNDFLGDVRVVAHLPNGAGNYAQWTPSAGDNYAAVDDNPPDNDTTYNASDTATQKDSFTMSNLPGGLTGTVLGIQTLLNCRKDDAGTRTVRPFWRISGADYNGAEVNIGDSYSYHIREITEQNPATAGAWTTGEIDALEAGYELVS